MQREVNPLPSPTEKIGEAEIYTGRGLLAALPEAVDGMTGGGRVLLVRDGEGRESAGRAEELLKGFGFRVTAKDAADADEAEECCLLSLGIGGREAAEAAKRAARKLGAECALFPVVPCEDGLLKGGGVRAVYLDDDVLDSSPADSRAAAAGIVLSVPVRKFEDAYAAKVLAEKPANEWDFSFSEEEPLSSCALKVIRTGAAEGVYAPDVTADMLRSIACARGRVPRRKGEYVFVAACALAAFYKAYLSSPAIDTLVPADHGAAPVKSVAGVELGSREPVFDITISAAKKSAFSRLTQNETAKECYQLGFFNPANADAALAALEMMDFEGIEKVRQRVRQNGTLARRLQAAQQQLAGLARAAARRKAGQAQKGAPRIAAPIPRPAGPADAARRAMNPRERSVQV